MTARARGARARADARLSGAIADFFLDDDDRLDERTRLMLARVLNGVIAGIETDIRRHAARLLHAHGDTARGEALLKAKRDIAGRLARAGLLRDRELMDELIGRVRQDVIADSLPTAIAGPDEASLLVRLSAAPDTIVAAAASALLAAESRRRSANASGTLPGSELPAELHHRLVWWVAAAIHEGSDDSDEGHAIAQAAQRSLAAHDEGDRTEAVAMRLAAAIDARADEVAPLLVEAIGDRQMSVFVAILARAAGMDYAGTRALAIDPDGDRLWMALRAIDADRTTIARIGLALSDADLRRDIEGFADQLDAIVAVPAEAARTAIDPLTQPRDFRIAIDTLARASRR